MLVAGNGPAGNIFCSLRPANRQSLSPWFSLAGYRPDPSIPTTSTLVPKLLQDSGYVEGRNLEVHRHFAEGKLDRLPQLAKELVDSRMDVIVAVSPTAIKPAQDATKSIPIVMGFGKDPVRDGFIASSRQARAATLLASSWRPRTCLPARG